MNYRNTIPVVATGEVRATMDYYIRVLGFHERFTFGDPLGIFLAVFAQGAGPKVPPQQGAAQFQKNAAGGVAR